MKNPIQPLAQDERGVLRFKENALVRHLLDWATARGCGMNELALVEASDDDREQFAQLIGYSLSGFGDLGYVSDETYNAAFAMHNEGLTEDKARISVLEKELSEMREAAKAMIEPVAKLLGMHPGDLATE